MGIEVVEVVSDHRGWLITLTNGKHTSWPALVLFPTSKEDAIEWVKSAFAESIAELDDEPFQAGS